MRTTTLVYYNPHKQSILQVDASGYGLGATLIQEGRPVAFTSKSLSPAETRYANIEREMLAIVFGCERFHNYIYGTRFIIHSGHKPLEMIVRKNLHSAPTRLQRMLIRVQQYDFDLEYKPGSEMLLADALSRQSIHDDKHINLDIQITPIQFSRRLLMKLQAETSEDPDLQFLRRTIQDGWPKDYGHIDRIIREYWPYRDELTIYEELIVKGQQIIIPEPSRKFILNTLHIPHLGIQRTSALARAHVYWPGISRYITDLIQACSKCQENQNKQPKEPMLSHEIPVKPWQYISTDIFYYNNKTYILICDFFTKFPFIYRYLQFNHQ